MSVTVCHCDFCQKRTGSVFGVGAYFDHDQVVEIRGESKSFNGLELDGIPAAGGGSATLHFCTTCGSTVYWDIPGLRGVAVGNFVDPGFSAPTIETWTSLRHHWVPPVESALAFEERFPDR
jgi:hypothetical protein